ncbi:hypothetical protein QJS10_CPA05g01617 [Acorus calamus]|uniref:VQ domain-containing protein n=1 Tax=Acorus calamus TaxID=4465 RepID=A0AAV9EUD9_ACOCL|nr:hypothetical protein QJS10_CPA05g01617 [Acorus calamus]
MGDTIYKISHVLAWHYPQPYKCTVESVKCSTASSLQNDQPGLAFSVATTMDSSSLLYIMSERIQEKKRSSSITAVHSLHSVRKPPSKPSKRPDPFPPKVYKVDPGGFRRLVQRLTGAPESLSQRHGDPTARILLPDEPGINSPSF